MAAGQKTSVDVQHFGQLHDKTVYSFTLSHGNVQVELISLGATITKVICPDRHGNVQDVVLGFNGVTGYDGTANPFFWGTTGRFTNRIRDGKFLLNGKQVQLSKNDFGTNNRHHVHGGHNSFDRIVWNSEKLDDGVVFSLVNEDGKEGYPGTLLASASYRLLSEGRLSIEYKAMTDQPTIVNLSNHVYFNLGGHGTGSAQLFQHKMTASADHYVVDDSDFLPTGEIKHVESSGVYDWRNANSDLLPINSLPAGICVNLCLKSQDHHHHPVATVTHPPTGRTLKVFTNQPGLEVYTSNFFPVDKTLVGKDEAVYEKYGAFVLMTQKYPDSPNHSHFPTVTLAPGQVYCHKVTYQFGISNE